MSKIKLGSEITAVEILENLHNFQRHYMRLDPTEALNDGTLTEAHSDFHEWCKWRSLWNVTCRPAPGEHPMPLRLQQRR